MKRDLNRSDKFSRFRGQIDADDGVDPREFFKPEFHKRSESRKAQQLGAQVAETLHQLLGEAADAALQSLDVVEVRPAPDATQFLVLVAPAVGCDCTATEATEALARANGWLRGEVAKAITRKRAPQLIFRLVPAATKEVRP